VKIGDSGMDFESIPPGMYHAVCAAYYDVGMQLGYQGGPNQKKVVILWEINLVRKQEGEFKGKRFQVTKIYTQSIGEKSALGRDLESWRGKKFAPEERKGFELDNLMGKSCQLNLVANGDRVKIENVLPADNAREYWTPETPSTYVPKFVQKMREEAIVEAPPKQDQFKDDIF
jgi:hypothetical protein